MLWFWKPKLEVVLLMVSGDAKHLRAYRLGELLCAHPYLPETRVVLAPGGKFYHAPIYVRSWLPASDATSEYYRSIEMNEDQTEGVVKSTVTDKENDTRLKLEALNLAVRSPVAGQTLLEVSKPIYDWLKE